MSTAPSPAPATPRRAAPSGPLGTAVESSDLLLHGTTAALALGPPFFPGDSPVTGALAASAAVCGPVTAPAVRRTAGTGGRDLAGEEPARTHTAPVAQKGAEA
ncbi:hypothetical protein SNE510_19760 [Streptomyces sp. NE5-10]|uniref:hypothetical protein n=1 Tax=Streptomyces sp. NE5-10 TaxID=2759674 RepID=UPI001906882E|nr:hypothetical protein [Streptomyces sp. NE5-10]GHJ92457.1 hypothetical protein SNE510_19760 [Streptomyces sp. NE5-10]